MNGTPDYSWEKFFLAVTTLASSQKNLRERLSDAYWHNLHSLTGSPMPWEDLRDRFEQLRGKLLPEISTHGEVNAHLDEDGLRELAAEIVSLFDRVCARYPRDWR